jgi:hypothetical protein
MQLIYYFFVKIFDNAIMQTLIWLHKLDIVQVPKTKYYIQNDNEYTIRSLIINLQLQRITI